MGKLDIHMQKNEIGLLSYTSQKKLKWIKDLNLRPETVTSSQDGGIGRYTLPPRTTKRRKTRNLKTKNNQNCQKIKLYGSPTTNELKKHSSGPVGGAEMGRWS